MRRFLRRLRAALLREALGGNRARDLPRVTRYAASCDHPTQETTRPLPPRVLIFEALTESDFRPRPTKPSPMIREARG